MRHRWRPSRGFVVMVLVILASLVAWHASVPSALARIVLGYWISEEWSGHGHDRYVTWYRMLGPKGQEDLLAIARSEDVPSYNRSLAIWTYSELVEDPVQIEEALVPVLHSRDIEARVSWAAMEGLHKRLQPDQLAAVIEREVAAMPPEEFVNMSPLARSLAFRAVWKCLGDERAFRMKLRLVHASADWDDNSWAWTYHLVREHAASADILPFVADLHIESPFFPMMKERNLFPHEWEALVEWMKHFDERYVIQRHPEQPSWTIERK